MKKSTRLLSIVLAVLMVISMVPVAAYAETTMTAKSLQEAIGLGGEIVLANNIQLTEGLTVPADKTVTLDLNGKVISRDTEEENSTSAITNNGTLIIKDSVGGGKITAFAANPDTASVPYYASNTITNCGTLTIKGGIIENSTGDNARAAFPIDNNSTSRDAILNITGGKVIGRGAIRQFANSTSNQNAVNISGGSVEGSSYGIWMQNPGSGDPIASLNVTGGNVTKILLSPSANFKPAISGGTVSEVAIWSADTTNPERNPSGFITGGKFGSDVSAFLKSGYWLANGEVVSFDSIKVIEIATKEALIAFAKASQGGNSFSGKTITLTADIDLGGMTWTPVKNFLGTFDGGNHTISNFHLDATKGHAGFFYKINFGNGTAIKNLTLSDITATVGNYYVGALAYFTFAVQDNITIRNFTVTTTASEANVGGYAGWVEWGHIRNCTIENMVVNAEKGAGLVGGLAAVLKADSWLQYNNIDVDGFKVTMNDTDNTYAEVGGLVGQTQTGHDAPVFTNCDIEGIDVTASGLVTVGGLVARPGAHTTAKNCTTEGKIDVTGVTSADEAAGGFFGNLGWNNNESSRGGHKLTDCTADVDIITKIAPAGGFVGSATNEQNRNMAAAFTNCSATGAVTLAEGGTAYIGGFAGEADRGTYTDCTAAQEPFIGGELSDNTTIVNHVAQIGNTKYESLAKAVEAVTDSATTITLLADVKLDDTLTIPADKIIILDLNGYTLSQEKACTASYSMIENKGDLTVKDSVGGGKISFTDTGVGDSNFGWGSYTLTNRGTLTVESGTIENLSAQNANGVVHMYCAIQQADGTVTVNGGKISTPTYRSVRVNKGNLIINGGEFEGQVWLQPNQGDTTLAVTGGTFTPKGSDSSSIFMTNTGEGYTVTSATISDGTFNGKIGTSDPAALAGSITGGTFTEAAKNGTNTALLADEVVFKDNGDGTYGVKAWYDESADTLYINNKDELLAFAAATNAGNTFSGKTVVLTDDIDLSSVANWTPIGNVGYNSKYAPTDSSKVFSGVFDGNNKVISNLKMSKTAGGADEEANLGLFGITGEGAVIKDLTITNVDIETDGRNVGALVAFAHKATIDNITVNGDIRIKGGNNVSGVCAMSRYYAASVTNIALKGNDGSTIVGNNIVGGIFAEIAPNGAAQTFKSLSVENVAISGVGGVGGLVGLQTGGTVENVSVKDVALTGRTDYQGNAMGRIRLGSVSGLMGGQNATIINASVDNVTAKNLDGNAVVLPVIGANYDASSNATEAKIGDTYYATLTAALKAAKAGDTITLLEDIEISEPINVKADLTIDGNGHTLTYTGTNRAIDVAMETNGADLTVKDLTVDCTASYCQRGINYNTTGTLTLDGVTVKGTNVTYAVNLPASSDKASVAVSDSKLTANIALNVWGEDAIINVVDSTLTNVDNSDVENYSAIQLNNNGTDVANGTSVNVIGGELIARDDSYIASNWSETGKISISNSTKIVMDTTGATVRTMVAIADGYGFVSLQDAIDWTKENSSSEPIKLLHDIELSESVNVTGKVTIDLNGKTIAGTDNNTTGNFGLINVQPGADLTVKDSVGGGKITLEATNDRDWNAYSSVISNQRGKLTVESGTIEHLGGTDMAYGIDNLTNGKGTYAETVINGGTVKSPYRAIRQFLNGVEAQNILTVNGGTIEGANKSIWMQDPSKNANTGTLTVTENASLKGDVYLYVTAGSTEWPVVVSIAAAAVDGEVITGNVPAGYDLANVNGTYSVCTGEAKIGDNYYDTVEAAVAAAQAGDTIELIANAEIENKINVLADLIIDGNGYTLTYTGSDRAIDVTKETDGADLTVRDLTVDCTASYCQRGINYNTTGTLTLDGVTVKGTNVTYAVNMPAYSDGATVEINDSALTGCIALNVWGENAAITANDTVFTSIDKTDEEGYAAIALNNDGNVNVADGTVITVNGGKIDARDENGAPSTATDNATATGKIIVSDTTEVIGEHRAAVAIVKYIGYNEFYSFYSLQEAIEKAENDPTATVMLLKDLKADEIITIEGAVTIDGNGKTLTSTAGRAINVDTTATVTIKNLTIVGGTGCQRGINIINQAGTTNLEEVDISGVSHYAVHVATSAGAAKVNIEDSDLTGYSALAIYGSGTTVNVTDSILKGVNTYTNNAQYPHSNDYGAIDVGTDNVTVTTKGGTITAVTGGDEWSPYQRILNINSRVEKIGGIILDSELVLEGERAEYLCNFSNQGTLSVRDDYADGIGAEGYTTKDADNGLVNVIYLPELPTATVTELENDDLTFALNFKADEATDEQLDFYGDWYADFVLTVNKDVTFNANGSADGYLSGQYENYNPDSWLNVPFEDVTLKADESFRIMAYAAEEFNKPEFKLTYNDVYNYVKEFNCGVFFTDEFLAENPDLVVSLELRMYNPDESESYIIGKAREYTAPEVDLVAEVDDVQYSSIQRAFDNAEQTGSTVTILKDHTIEKVVVLPAGKTVTLDLNGKTLKAADGIIPMIRVNGNLTVTGEGEMTCASEDAYCFIVGQNVDGNLTKGTLTIKNGTFHAATTVASVTAGTLNVEGGHFSVAPYEGSYAYVLNCIDANYKNGNAEIVVTGGTFANFDPNNNASEGNGTDYVPFLYTSTAKENGTWTVEAGIASYDFPTATVTELDNDDLTFALNFLADEVTDEQLAYFGNWYADFELTLNKDATFCAGSDTADGHLSGQYDAWSPNWVNVPFTDVEMKAGETFKIMAYAAELMGEPGLKYTYKEVYDFVKDFDCGVFFTDKYLAENPDLKVTLELRMYNPADESESYVIGETYVFEAPIIPVGDAVCVNTNTNKQYDTVAKGLADAKAGETVQLLKNCSEGYVLVTPGVTLDLNGKELTAQYVIGFNGSNVIDSVETATDVPGKLIVKKDNVVLDKNNAQMSVYDGEGYLFASMAATTIPEPGQITFTTRFGSYNNTRVPAYAAIANGEIDDTLDVKVRVSWIDDGGTYVATQDYTYTEETVKIVFDSYDPNPETDKGTFRKNFYAKFTSAAFEGMTPSIAVVVTSSTGVEFVTASYTLEF